jgi:hypothetical protein
MAGSRENDNGTSSCITDREFTEWLLASEQEHCFMELLIFPENTYYILQETYTLCNGKRYDTWHINQTALEDFVTGPEVISNGKGVESFIH